MLLAVVLVLLPRARARAANLPHHDLTSLALESDAIVRARITSSRDSEHRTVVHTHTILEVYTGTFAVGDVLELDYGSLVMDGDWGAKPPWGDAAIDEVVLFIQWSERTQGWWLIGSGLRVFAGDRVHRFVQAGNPGPYRPIVAGHDPYDLYGDPRGDAGVSPAEFEPELRAAIERAAQVRDALAAIDDPDARARLVELVGPAWGEARDEPCATRPGRNFEDLVLTTSLRALRDAGYESEFLDVVSRIRGGEGWSLHGLRSSYRRWLQVARDREQPIHRRLAALRLMAEDWPHDDEPVFLAALVEMLEQPDPDPRIRAAVAAIPPNRDAPVPTWWAAILERLRVEDDPAVRFALVQNALTQDRDRDLGLSDERWPMLVAERCGLAVELRWLCPSSHCDLSSLDAEARHASGEIQRLSLDLTQSWWRSPTHGVDAWLLFDPPLPDEPIALSLAAQFETTRGPLALRFDLQPLGVPPDPAIVEPPTPEPLPTETPPGCGCTSTGQPRGGGSALFVLLLSGLRRRTERRRS